MKMASWSRASEHLVNSIGMSDQLKWNNQCAFFEVGDSSTNETSSMFYEIKKGINFLDV